MNILASNKTLLNQFGENITMFPVKRGTTIKEGDFVVVNTRTWLASLPKKKSGYYAVGRAIRLITATDGNTFVICRDGIFHGDNTMKPQHRISKENVTRACYFCDDQTVSLNNINATKAGTIISVMEDGVLIKIDVNEGSGMQW